MTNTIAATTAITTAVTAANQPAIGRVPPKGGMVRRLWIMLAVFAGVFGATMLLPSLAAHAQSLSLDLGNQANQGGITGRVVQLIALMTVLSLAPAIVVTVTSFTRLIIVLSFLRTAIGIAQTPPNVVLISLSLFLTGFIMAPVLEKSYNEGVTPLVEEQIDEMTAFPLITNPFKEFMLKNVRQKDLQLFFDLAKQQPVAQPMDTPMKVVVPAFMISELRRAFEIGFLLFLPFLIIDMVVASILMSMGMMMVPPSTISLPFKIIFFVLVDGWYLIAGSLVQSYNT
jgi:flagellar biosynthetic protein FliP